MSHYFAQEMFSKVLVSPTLPSPYNTLKVSIVSDHLEPLEVELMVKIQRWDELENHYLGPSIKDVGIFLAFFDTPLPKVFITLSADPVSMRR